MTTKSNLVRDGYVLVPREPTEAMLWSHELPHVGPDEIRELWSAMLAAEPASDSTSAREEVERAYRLAYAPLRSAQHALDIISRRGEPGEVRSLAREEGDRIEEALAALDLTSPRAGEGEGVP